MKSIFTKLSALLFCGVVALVGCRDFSADLQYIDEKVDKLAAHTEKQIKDLSASIAETYATKAELAGVEGQLKDLKASVEALQALLDEKATKAEVLEAIADLEAKIAAIKGCECEPTDLTAVNEKLAELEAAIAAIKGCECEPSEPCQCEPVDLTAIDEAIEAIQAQIDATEKALDEIEAKLKEIDPAFAQVNAAIADAMASAEAAMEAAEAAMEAAQAAKGDVTAEDIAEAVEAAKAEVAAAFAQLEAQLDEEIEAVKKALGDAIADFADDYEALNDKIAELKAELEAAIENLAKELRGIVMVPQIIKNGTPAIEFKSFVYVPMTDSDEYVSAEGAEGVVVGDPTTVAYFHFNPSNFDVNSATYSIVSTTVETRAAAEPVATVGKVVKEGDKVKAELIRGKGADNMFAFAATLENGAVITSDYALVLDARTNADNLVIVDNNDVPLYATYVEAVENDPKMNLDNINDRNYNFAEYVKAIDPVFAAFGVEYKYSLVYSDGDAKEVTVAEDGVADFLFANGVQIVKVEAMHGENVVRRAYVKVYVNYTEPDLEGVYFSADALASVQAERLAFEVKDIFVWAKALKDEPNTIEILKEVKDIVVGMGEIAQGEESELQKAYLLAAEAEKAVELLNGVPGFVKKYQTFTGKGYAKVRVEYIPQITSIAELKAVVEMLEEQYAADLMANFTKSLVDFLPESLTNNFLVAWILDELADFQLSDILENDTVVNLLTYVESYIDFPAINSYLNSVLEEYLGQSVIGETAAKLTVEAQARAMAETELKASVEATNAELMANFENGIWGKLYKFINVDLNIEENEIVAQILDQYQLTETIVALEEMVMEVIDYGEDLVKYTYESDNITYTVDVERYIVEY
jgi:predicted  nucleic acid-binding Zn-ribbon protein